MVSSSGMSNRTDQTRLLIVEDVPQVAQYIRGLLNAQHTVKVLDVLTDGGKALTQIGELRPERASLEKVFLELTESEAA